MLKKYSIMTFVIVAFLTQVEAYIGAGGLLPVSHPRPEHVGFELFCWKLMDSAHIPGDLTRPREVSGPGAGGAKGALSCSSDLSRALYRHNDYRRGVNS